MPDPALEDFAVGDVIVGAPLTVTRDAIVGFAQAFDFQPFHLDEAAAARTLLGGLAASGWHTAALTMRLLIGGGAPIAGGVIGASVEIAWPRPVRPGDELQAASEVMEITQSRSKPDRGIVVLKSETRNQRGETVLEYNPLRMLKRK